MRKIDDTPIPESESERPEWFERWIIETQMAMIHNLQSQVNRLKVQLATLETRKNWQSHQEENDDPEWYA